MNLRRPFAPFLFACTLALAAAAPVSFAYGADVGPKIKLKPGQSYMGRFTHDHPVQGVDRPLHMEGRFTVTRGEGIAWEIEKPMMTNTIITQNGLSQTLGEFPMLSVKPTQVPYLKVLEQNLLLALSGDWDKLRGDFEIKSTGSDQAWTVTIIPIQRAEAPKPFQQIVAKGGKFVDSAEVVLPSGVVDTVTFSDQFVTKK